MKRCRYCGAEITASWMRRFCSYEHADASRRHDAANARALKRAGMPQRHEVVKSASRAG